MLIFLLLFLVCFGCDNKGLMIEPIDRSRGGDGIYYMLDIEDPYCFERQYYTLVNYENIAPDSLYEILNNYVNSRHSYEEVAENIKHHLACNFTAHFYEKSFFVNYEKYLSDAIWSEKGGIDKYSHKLIAKIYTLGRDGNNPIFHTVVYNNDNRDSIMLIKRDTVMVFSCEDNSDSSTDNSNTFTDIRDGKAYKIVKIGEQTWMAENLNYNAENSKCGGTTNLKKEKGIRFSVYYYPLEDKNTKNCEKYGRLYNWETALKACPDGWHLPSIAEWDTLIAATGGWQAGKNLKAKSGWRDFEKRTGNGKDKFGFSALPGGAGYSEGYQRGDYGWWWSASEYNSDRAYCRYMANHIWGADDSLHDKPNLLSVRCIKDSVRCVKN